MKAVAFMLYLSSFYIDLLTESQTSNNRGSEKATTAVTTNTESKMASIVRMSHREAFRSIFLHKNKNLNKTSNFFLESYLDLSTTIEATLPTRPKAPTVGSITPSKVSLVM